jgi:large subunit ribosomal protein L24
MKMKIKKGDTIIVLSGKDRGRQGKVLRTIPKEERAVVEGVNMRKRRTRAKRAGEKGSVVEFPAPMHVSNMSLYCGACKRGVRVGTDTRGGKKVRVCVRCDKAL